jgi:diaminopimelate epimerase
MERTFKSPIREWGFFLYIPSQKHILTSMKKIKFNKYHGLGNDFLIIDHIQAGKSGLNYGRLATAICHPHFGIGADGILVLTKSKLADCRMDIYNSDGSWAEKSGNGLRIAAAYYYSHFKKKKNILIESGREVLRASIIKAKNDIFLITVSLGKPVFDTKLIPIKSKDKYHINRPIKIAREKLRITALSVGNPHSVIFVDNFNFDWKELGKAIENDAIFPHRTNVEFVKIVSRSKVVLNDWERGAGATGSSGTGAAAAVTAGVVNGILNRRAEVVFPSGSLAIDWSESDDIIYLTGPVEFVGSGEYPFAEKK